MNTQFNKSQILATLMRNPIARKVIIVGFVLLIGYMIAQPKLNDWFGWKLPGIPGDESQQASVDDKPDGDLKAERDYPAEQYAERDLPAERLPFEESTRSNTQARNQQAEKSSDRPLGELTEIRPRVFESTAGLLYGSGSKDGHRKTHVLTHAKDDPTRNQSHGVFDGGEEKVFAIIDEAYLLVKQKDSRVSTKHEGDRDIHEIDMRRKIGYVGGATGRREDYPDARHVRLVLEDRWVITAFPFKK